MKTIHPTTNGLTIHQGGCTCEQGLFQHNGEDNFRSCSLKEKVRNETGRSQYVKYKQRKNEKQRKNNVQLDIVLIFSFAFSLSLSRSEDFGKEIKQIFGEFHP